MDTIQKGTTVLIKCAVTGKTGQLPEGFDLEAAWPRLERHHMTSLLYEGALLCGISRDSEFMRKLFVRCVREFRISEAQLREQERLFSAFQENGIDFMPLKGSNMKSRYPRPELRSMGDADVLIRLDQYPRIVPIMESLGFEAVLESDHELIWKSKGLYLELHKWVIPSYNEDFYRYFGDGWKLAKTGDGSRWSMTPEDEFVYLFTHFAKHYRDGGIGCRHVTDLWVFRRTFPGLDESYVRAELAKLELLEFYDHMVTLLNAWFEDGTMDEKTRFITEFVFSSGSWGQWESRFLSQVVRKSERYSDKLSGKQVFLWTSLFPGVKALSQKYTVLKKAPWLLPGVWVYRIGTKVLFDRAVLKKQQQNLRAVDEEKVDTKRQMLHYVGLKF